MGYGRVNDQFVNGIAVKDMYILLQSHGGVPHIPRMLVLSYLIVIGTFSYLFVVDTIPSHPPPQKRWIATIMVHK
jgi:hypothetical protein